MLQNCAREASGRVRIFCVLLDLIVPLDALLKEWYSKWLGFVTEQAA